MQFVQFENYKIVVTQDDSGQNLVGKEYPVVGAASDWKLGSLDPKNIFYYFIKEDGLALLRGNSVQLKPLPLRERIVFRVGLFNTAIGIAGAILGVILGALLRKGG